MSAIPPSIRNILKSGRGEIKQLERQYHIWLGVTVLALASGLIMIIVAIMLFLIDTEDNLTLIRILVGLAAAGDFIVSYVVFQETLARRRYLLEVQRLMVSGMSFLDSIRRGFRDLFN